MTLEVGAALQQACAVGTAFGIKTQNVVPGAHLHAAVDCDRTYRGVRKNKAQRQVLRQSQFRDNGFEIVAIGTQAMQPDYAADGVFTSDDFDRLWVCHKFAPDFVKAAQCNA